MGLFVCPDCGGIVSEHAIACPHCGCPIERIRVALEAPKKDVETNSRSTKTGEANEVNEQPVIEDNKALTSLVGTVVFNKKGEKGEIVQLKDLGYCKHINVRYRDREASYVFPNAIIEGYITLSDGNWESLLKIENDIAIKRNLKLQTEREKYNKECAKKHLSELHRGGGTTDEWYDDFDWYDDEADYLRNECIGEPYEYFADPDYDG